MQSAPRRALELHDATVLEVTDTFGVVSVRLEAFVHDDRKGKPSAGCWQRIDLDVHDATFERHGPGDMEILDGSLRIDDRVTDNMLPIPFQEKGAVVATLMGADLVLTVHARGLWLRVAGPPGERVG
jgi:hypothetical protein